MTVASLDSRSVVLVVEDEPSYQDALNIGLTIEGFTVVAASTIAQAHEAMAHVRPDLVLLDVMLPDGSGIDLCRQIYDTSRIPVIMVSARSSEVDVVLGLEIGAADYVTELELSRKEFDLLALFASRLGQVVTREVCLDTLWWGLELTDTRTLDTHVKRLRQKVEDDPASPRHLLTIRGVGFRLDA
jgi:two-component system response regulator RegX3